MGYLGIQRAGKVSVSVDPTAPPERVRTILHDVEASLLLSGLPEDADGALDLPVHEPLRFAAEDAGGTRDAEPEPIDRERGELVSVAYTSGSTGAPKGIMIGRVQRNAMAERLADYNLAPGARLGAPTAGSVALGESIIGSALVLKGTLAAYEIRRHGIAPLADWIERTDIELFYGVPTVLRHLLATLSPERRFPAVRLLLSSGESLAWRDVERLRRHLDPDAVIVNGFGQTETGGIASLFIPSDMPAGEGAVPAGRVSPDVEVRITGADGCEVPAGSPGELVVRSPYLALGYWRRADLTASTFRVLEDGRREVRTGDGARLRADGILEHLGRLDHLVKIHGNRVELGEVELALSRLDGIAAAAATARLDESGDNRLVACVVPETGARLDPRIVRVGLARQLPGYMVPSRVVLAAELPRLTGGKVDRLAIAELASRPEDTTADHDEDDSGGGAETTAFESGLREIWRDVLHLEQIGRHDDFFALGGTSLQAAEVFVELERRLGIDGPVSLLAEAPTVGSLALLLQDDTAAPWEAVLPLRTEGSRPPLFVLHDGVGSLLFARGLLDQLGPDQPLYGLRCRVLDGFAPTEESFEQLAAGYVERIVRLYPHGPYSLYGVSLGGVLALEIARQLIASGEDVPLVVLGDSIAPGQHENTQSRRERRLGQRHELAELGAAGQLAYLVRLGRRHLRWRLGLDRQALQASEDRLASLRARRERVDQSEREELVLHSLGRLMSAYRPRPPFPQVLLLRTGELGEAPTRGWAGLLGSALQIVDIPDSTHVTLSTEASSPLVGPLIAQALTGHNPA